MASHAGARKRLNPPRACGPGGFGAGSTTVHLPRPACSTSPVFSSRSSDSTVEQRGCRSRSWLFRELQRFARRWDKARQLRHPRRRRRHLRSNGCEVLPCEFAVRCVLAEREMAIPWPYGQPPPPQQGFAFATKLLERLAPRAGLEPATIRLTVELPKASPTAPVVSRRAANQGSCGPPQPTVHRKAPGPSAGGFFSRKRWRRPANAIGKPDRRLLVLWRGADHPDRRAQALRASSRELVPS